MHMNQPYLLVSSCKKLKCDMSVSVVCNLWLSSCQHTTTPSMKRKPQIHRNVEMINIRGSPSSIKYPEYYMDLLYNIRPHGNVRTNTRNTSYIIKHILHHIHSATILYIHNLLDISYMYCSEQFYFIITIILFAYLSRDHFTFTQVVQQQTQSMCFTQRRLLILPPGQRKRFHYCTR